MGRLAGKSAFISGTGAGTGRAAALVFAAEGATVFGCGLGNPDGPRARSEARVPVGRVGEPEDNSRAAAFLRSDQAAFVNGANLMVGVGVGDSVMGG